MKTTWVCKSYSEEACGITGPCKAVINAGMTLDPVSCLLATEDFVKWEVDNKAQKGKISKK
jgi:hypothetical protein